MESIIVLLQGGDVLQENISANVSDDTVSLEFQRSDGTLVTQLIDFRNVSEPFSFYFTCGDFLRPREPSHVSTISQVPRVSYDVSYRWNELNTLLDSFWATFSNPLWSLAEFIFNRWSNMPELIGVG